MLSNAVSPKLLQMISGQSEIPEAGSRIELLQPPKSLFGKTAKCPDRPQILIQDLCVFRPVGADHIEMVYRLPVNGKVDAEEGMKTQHPFRSVSVLRGRATVIPFV